MAETINGNILQISEDLIITLAADESFILYSKGGQKLLEIIMASNEHSVTVNTVPITQKAAGTDIGNTGWICEEIPSDSDRDDQLGIDSTIPDTSPRDSIRGGTRRRR